MLKTKTVILKIGDDLAKLEIPVAKAVYHSKLLKQIEIKDMSSTKSSSKRSTKHVILSSPMRENLSQFGVTCADTFPSITTTKIVKYNDASLKISIEKANSLSSKKSGATTRIEFSTKNMYNDYNVIIIHFEGVLGDILLQSFDNKAQKEFYARKGTLINRCCHILNSIV